MTPESAGEHGLVHGDASTEEVSLSSSERELEDMLYPSLHLLVLGKTRGYLTGEHLSASFHHWFPWSDLTPEIVDFWMEIIRGHGIEWRNGTVHSDNRGPEALYHPLIRDSLRAFKAVTSEESARAFVVHAAHRIRTAAAETPEFNPGEFYAGFRQAVSVNVKILLKANLWKFDTASERGPAADRAARLLNARRPEDREGEHVRQALERLPARFHALLEGFVEQVKDNTWRIHAVNDLGAVLGVVPLPEPIAEPPAEASVHGTGGMPTARGRAAIAEVWGRIIAHEGDTFHQIRGQAFTYTVDGRVLRPSTTNQNLSLATFEQALGRVPLASTVVVQDLRGPSYLYAILMDQRIRQGNW
jgi:hypothetical protein